MIKYLIAAILTGLPCAALAQTPAAPATEGDTKVDLVFSGGHDTVGEDRGRPVVLIAAALKVPDKVFRDTFKNVHQAHNSGGPTDAEARANKEALLAGLAPYGVTDDRLNEVSNYYRYRRSAGELWRNTPAKAVATVKDGVVTSVTITDAGSGYTSPPTISIAGVTVSNLTAELAFGTDLATNGSIKEIKIGK
jgi:hypothetical protein